MSVNLRFEKDHLQSIADQLCDAINCFYAGAASDTVLNLTNGCSDKAKNLATFYKKKGAIPPIKFWSSRELSNGQDSYIVKYGRPTSNWTKHADSDTEGVRLIGREYIAPQVLAAVVDFQQLKESLVNNNIARTTRSEHFYQRGGMREFSGIINFVDPIARLKHKFAARAYDKTPKVDVVSGIFLDWYAATSLNKDSPIQRLISAPPCDLPKGQTDIFSKAVIEALKYLSQSISSYKGYSESETQFMVRHETIFAAGLTLKFKGCTLGSNTRRHYYIDSVKGNAGDLAGSIPYSLDECIHSLELK